MQTMIEDGPGREFRWVLFTADAHGLYEQFGFAAPDATAMVRPSRQADQRAPIGSALCASRAPAC